MITVGGMMSDDVAFADELAASFGWTTCAGWFRALLAHDPDGCFVARVGDRAVAMVTTTRYARSAWVGNLMVSPQSGTLGLGTALLERALDHLDARGVATIHLDADPPGRRIYERHGFVTQFASRRFRSMRPPRDASTSAVPLPLHDLPAVAKLDLDAFGDDRRRLLQLLHAEAECALAVRRANRIVGYAVLTATNAGVYLGPWVAEDPAAAAELLAAADRHRGDRTLKLGVPGPNRGAVALLQSWGFEETPASLRMTRGTSAQPGMCEQIFGLGNGAVG
jgi:GNAT superfamily N-acetyltransferase